MDRGPGGPANQRRQWARAVCVLAPVLVARAPGYLRRQPTAGPHRGHTQLTRLAPAPPSLRKLGPTRDGAGTRRKQKLAVMRLATKTNSLPPSLSWSSPSRPPSSPALFVSTAGPVLRKTTNKPTSRSRRGTGETRRHLRLMMGLVGVGPWHLGAATGRHER